MKIKNPIKLHRSLIEVVCNHITAPEMELEHINVTLNILSKEGTRCVVALSADESEIEYIPNTQRRSTISTSPEEYVPEVNELTAKRMLEVVNIRLPESSGAPCNVDDRIYDSEREWWARRIHLRLLSEVGSDYDHNKLLPESDLIRLTSEYSAIMNDIGAMTIGYKLRELHSEAIDIMAKLTKHRNAVIIRDKVITTIEGLTKRKPLSLPFVSAILQNGSTLYSISLLIAKESGLKGCEDIVNGTYISGEDAVCGSPIDS